MHRLNRILFKDIENLMVDAVAGLSHSEPLDNELYEKIVERTLEVLYIRNAEIKEIVDKHGFEKVYEELINRFQHFKREQVL